MRTFTLALGLASPALAGLSQAVIVPPGGFIQAAAYDQGCCSYTTGGDITAFMGTGQDFHEQAFAAPAGTTQSASFSNATLTQSCSGTVSMGRMSLFTTQSFPDFGPFPGAAINGGWKESLTVNHPTLNGQGAHLVFQVRVRGTMHCSGGGGSDFIATTGYKDNIELSIDPYFDRGNSDPIGTTYQRAVWVLTTFGAAETRNVDGAVTMSVPITFGTPFTLGVYASSIAGQRASGGVGGSSFSSASFPDGVVWGGITAIQGTSGPVTGYTIISGSGINWAPSLVCYANCDSSTTPPILNIQDFSCFLNLFATGSTAANCDGSTTPPVLNIQDFSCFLNKFAVGCS